MNTPADMMNVLRIRDPDINYFLDNLVHTIGPFMDTSRIYTNLLKTRLYIPCDELLMITLDIKNYIFRYSGPPIELTVKNQEKFYYIPIDSPQTFDCGLILNTIKNSST